MDFRKQQSIFSDGRGATMLEYALLAALIALVAVTGVGYAGEQAALTFDATAEAVAGAITPNPEDQQDGFP